MVTFFEIGIEIKEVKVKLYTNEEREFLGSLSLRELRLFDRLAKYDGATFLEDFFEKGFDQYDIDKLTKS